MDFTDIIYQKKDGVASITINRPEKHNALRFQTLTELHEALFDARTDKTIGVVVLSGAGGKAFCSGADLSEGEPPGTRAKFIAVARELTNMPKPLIAMVNGYAIGSGNWFAYCCDLTIASENSVFGQVGPRVGSAPAGFMLPYLSRVVGEKRAREMWFLCHRYSAQEALAMGLINKVVPADRLEGETNRWCQELLAMSPTSLKIAKLNFVLGAALSRIADIFEEFEATDYLATEESKEGMTAFLEKRKPDFSKFRK